FGKIGCFSTQTYKHMNSGEGGLLVTNDDDIIAQAILYSGSYMLYDTHLSRPSLEVFEQYIKMIPNYSLRMTNLQAALLRPQLKDLDAQVARWNKRYQILESVYFFHTIQLLKKKALDDPEDFAYVNVFALYERNYLCFDKFDNQKGKVQ
ncbi:MAG: DegT/DnrJ/EryC1/StrS family aminotransferase, partial [Desulfobacterales bacterium]|nr:DegT/DnrJ/EryC1/StrS family aminotransferase [Desulfobacterales bacterium]